MDESCEVCGECNPVDLECPCGALIAFCGSCDGGKAAIAAWHAEHDAHPVHEVCGECGNDCTVTLAEAAALHEGRPAGVVCAPCREVRTIRCERYLTQIELAAENLIDGDDGNTSDARVISAQAVATHLYLGTILPTVPPLATVEADIRTALAEPSSLIRCECCGSRVDPNDSTRDGAFCSACRNGECDQCSPSCPVCSGDMDADGRCMQSCEAHP